MRARIWKWLLLTIAGPIAIILIVVGAWIVSQRIAFERVNITDALLRDTKYDPAAHFRFDRACTFSPESDDDSFWFRARGYRQLDDSIYLADPLIQWSLVLIDDGAKTYRKLYVIDEQVKSPGYVCNSKITLRTEIADGRVVAFVEETRGR